MMKRWCTALACALLAFLVVPASPVGAHASLVSSDPADGSVLAESPPVAELKFTEGALIDASSVSLLQLGSGQTQQLALTAADGGRTLLADIPKLEKGAYILRFVAVDPADLHKTVGSISFGIGVAAPPSVSGEQVSSSWVVVGLRVVSDVALLLAAGGVIVAVLLVRNGRRDIDHVARLILLASGVVTFGWIELLIADAAAVGFDNVRWGSLLLKSDPGRRALIGVQLALGMWFAVRLLRRGGDHAAQWFVVRILAVIAGGFVVANAYGGHAGIGGSFIVGVGLRAVHLASLCVWIGAVAAMWLLVRGDPRLRTLWPSVSKLAAMGLAVTGASGLLLSGRVATSVTALLGTTYGQRIVVKAGVLVVLSVLGAMAARRVRRGSEPRRLPLELALALFAVLVASLLASSAPARGEQFLPLPTIVPQLVTSDVLDLTVSASIEPAQPGANLVQVRVLESRRPPPGPIESVSMRLTRADGTAVTARDGVPVNGLLEWADVAIPAPGTYRVEVEITRSVAPVPPFVASWAVDAAPVPRAERVVSTRSWAPLADVLAGLWIVVVAAGYWVLRRRGSESPTDEIAPELVR